MSETSIDLRRRMVAAYTKKLTPTYEQTAKMFQVGVATVNRTLRRHRETGDVLSKPKGGNNPRKVDLAWLKTNAEMYPDAVARDRIVSWQSHSGVLVSESAMYNALHAIEWSHKKRLRSPKNVNVPTSKNVARNLSRSKKHSTRQN